MNETKAIARAVRIRFENKQIDAVELLKLYQEYNSIPDPELFLDRANQLFPRLNCGLATIYLKQVLGYGEVVQGKYQENGHTFLLIPGDIVVDITADQFGGPAIYVGSLREPWRKADGETM